MSSHPNSQNSVTSSGPEIDVRNRSEHSRRVHRIDPESDGLEPACCRKYEDAKFKRCNIDRLTGFKRFDRCQNPECEHPSPCEEAAVGCVPDAGSIAGKALCPFHLALWADTRGDQETLAQLDLADEIANTIETANEYRDDGADEPIVTSQSSTSGVSTRTLRRWFDDVSEQLADHDDPRWKHLTFYGLQRTWATQLKGENVDSLLVCDWGGWEDLETFLEHYRGTYAPEVPKREREKVEWLC